MKIHILAFTAAACAALVFQSPPLYAQSSDPPSDDPKQTAGSEEPDDAEGDLDAELDALEEEVTSSETSDDGDDSSESIGGAVSSTVQSMNPEISLILDATGAWFSDTADLRGGHDPSSMGFNLQGLELAVGASVDPFFRFDGSILFSLFGVEIEEAYGTTLNLPLQLQARFGQFKTNFGRLNPTHLHSWAFATQPLVNAKFFGGESLRGLGVELSQIVLPIPGTFRWYVSVQNISGEATGRSFLPSSSDISSLTDLTATVRLEEYVDLSENLSLLTGLNYAVGRNKSGRRNVSEIYGLDLFLKWKNATEGGRSSVGWQTEFMIRRRQVPRDVLEDYGGYTQVRWRPNRYWGTGLRYEYVSGIGPESNQPSLFGGTTQAVDPLDPNWTKGRQRGAAQVSYYPSHFSRLRLQYSLDHMPYRSGSGNSELVHQVFLQAELVAGSHGSHEF